MVFVYVSTHVSEFPINTILAWIINNYHEQGNIIITNLLLPLGHFSNKTCHHDFSFQLDYASHDSYFVEFAPTTMNEKNFAYDGSSKISMQVDHQNNDFCAGYIVEF